VLWVKGSGSDLGTIRPHQFTGLRLDDLQPLLDRASMSDEELVSYYEHAVLGPGQPRASIETPLHSMLPFEHIDHTHPDAIIALCAAPDGPQLAERVWNGRAVWIDYERPGFALGKKIALLLRERPDATCVLMAKHGLVTWGAQAEECYASTIDTIGRASCSSRTSGSSPADQMPCRPVSRLRSMSARSPSCRRRPVLAGSRR
jgi:rhamnose utilization protein RhaD (predicted bifunctional aldolase and dehydrogenase)